MKLTEFLPFENHVLTTTLSTLEILRRIHENMEPEPGFKLSGFYRKFTKSYSGHIQGLNFTMSRNINYRNSFLPIITGRIETFPGVTQVIIKMQLHSLVLIFVSLWLGITGLLCIGIIIAGLLDFTEILHSGFSPMVLVPFGMFTFGLILITLPFKYESKKTIQFLTELIESNKRNK